MDRLRTYEFFLEERKDRKGKAPKIAIIGSSEEDARIRALLKGYDIVPSNGEANMIAEVHWLLYKLGG